MVGTMRLLVVAHESIDSEDVCDAIVERADADSVRCGQRLHGGGRGRRRECAAIRPTRQLLLAAALRGPHDRRGRTPVGARPVDEPGHLPARLENHELRDSLS
jgi:hypothetical protein